MTSALWAVVGGGSVAAEGSVAAGTDGASGQSLSTILKTRYSAQAVLANIEKKATFARTKAAERNEFGM